MIKIENTQIHGWEAAIRGMRNPMNSWDKSDSEWVVDMNPVVDKGFEFVIGPNDLDLMRRLAKAGSDHSKYLRMITVTADITAPLYWWKEFDTYKVGTVANSCSTMHKIHSAPITLDDFSLDHVKLCEVGKQYFEELEKLRVKFVETGDKKYWYALIQLLPESYMQRRTVQLNYMVGRNMNRIGRRKNHKLDEWHEFCDWVDGWPYYLDIFPNEDKALTVEELQKMAGEPVYVVAFDEKDKGLDGWCVMYDDGSSALVPGSECFEWIIEKYGETWIAYRQKPMEG